MEQRDYIEKGIALKGSLSALGRYIDQGEAAMREARNGKRGLPVYACVSLAKLLDVPPMEIIAASELVTAKTEERRALFLPFVQAARNMHLTWIAGIAGLIVLAETLTDGVRCTMCLISYRSRSRTATAASSLFGIKWA